MAGIINQTVVTEFILLGFSYQTRIKYTMFFIFLVVYVVTLIANSLVILVILTDSHFNSPMYFFLCNLSLIDLCYSSSSIPKSLEGMVANRSAITFPGCAAQMYCGLALGVAQCILLAVMAWDRYVAICRPLNYQVIMNKSVCYRLALITWCSAFLLSLVFVSVTLTTPFCGKHQIDHSACETKAVLRLACTDIHVREAVIFLMSVAILFIPVCIIFFTYTYIIFTILRMPSASGRHKAFSTCGSHLTVVILFFGTAMAMYLSPTSKNSAENNKVMSLFYGAVTPMLNPLIYTLRNNEVKGAVHRLFCRKT
ncbi:olfactory receptor 13C4-like [Ambystoma mexicanum]|uniref:olfactory receptor 13C4-like n=1 Tax=Ambystoma mexicanum TaxID=8296 RepID=UPI0037E82434